MFSGAVIVGEMSSKHGGNLSKNVLLWSRSNNEGGGLKTQNISNGKINLGWDREGMEIVYCVFCLTKDGWKHHVGWPERVAEKGKRKGRQLRKKEEEERTSK